MGCGELIDSLRSIAGEKVLALQRESELEAERIRADASGRVARMRAEFAEKLSGEAARTIARACAEAGARARTLRLAAEHKLAKRLLLAGVASLQHLRTMDYEANFARMTQELPVLAWKIVRVHPDDGDRARSYFPEAKIIFDNDITGGVDVMTEGEGIRVVNTLEKRLERAWPDMLPDLIAEARREAADAAISSSD